MIKFKSIIIWLCKNFNWKERDEAAIYKCGNKNCPYRIGELNKLNPDEIKLREKRSSQFKINYQFREYHFQPYQLKVAQPLKPKVDLNHIHNDMNVFALILTLHISYAITTRKTAHMLRNIWGINVSYQTVLNYVVPSEIPELNSIKNIQGKRAKIISMAWPA